MRRAAPEPAWDTISGSNRYRFGYQESMSDTSGLMVENKGGLGPGSCPPPGRLMCPLSTNFVSGFAR